MKLIQLKSLNFSKKKRNSNKIKLIILHYTGMQSMRASIKRLTDKKQEVSCHYLISRKGKVYQLVDDNKIAWHAGKSKWDYFKDLNDKSIGIELVNKGHKFGYQQYPDKQINALIKICIKLKKKYNIKNRLILGHSDIAPLRKLDPGEKFPWYKLNKRKIGILYNSSKQSHAPLNFIKEDVRKIFFRNLHKIGYRYFSKFKSSKTDKLVIKSFQRRFRQVKVNGLIDLECLRISEYLVKNR